MHSVPHYPAEDAKQRASSLSVRRGGNCPNSAEVLQQLLWAHHHHSSSNDGATPPASAPPPTLHLVASLPAADSAGTARIAASFAGPRGHADADAAGWVPVSLAHSVCRAGHGDAASSYIVRSAATGSRTIVNFNDLPEMTAGEFAGVVAAFAEAGGQAGGEETTWWHFEVSVATE